MNETKFEIFYRLLNDDGRAPWQPAGTLDGLVWNGTMQLRITGDAAPLALPFELGNEDILILAVKEHSHDIMNTANCIIAQTLTRVDRTTGNVFVYSRSRRTVAGKQQWSEWEALNGATTAMLQDGSVTTPKLAADVREKVDNPLRPLFIAAGAEYNDSGADKTKTAPWGETVTHKAGHYYLNGLGDITEEQMMEIYNHRDVIYRLNCSRILQNNKKIRTIFPCIQNAIDNTLDCRKLCGSYSFYNTSIEELVFHSSSQTEFSKIRLMPAEGCLSETFSNCIKLKRIGAINCTNVTLFNNVFNECTSLEQVRMYNVAKNISFSSSSKISKDSIQYIVQHGGPTSAITITLHPDAYARLVNDADIIAVLEAQPLVSLVSA